MEVDDVEGDEVKGEEGDDVEEVEDKDRSQDREPFTGKMPPTKTGDDTAREPAQSKCASTSHNGRKFTGKRPDHESLLIRKVRGKMQCHKNGDDTLYEPGQSKCTSTRHESHLIRKVQGKMPGPRWSTLIKHRPYSQLP